MAKRKISKRCYRMITFKVFEDTDSDILNWWQGIDDGERSDALRDLIRGYLGQQPRRQKLLNIPELLEVRQDTLWIRDALNDLPGYMERVIQHVAAMHPIENGRDHAVRQPTQVADDATLARRKAKLSKVAW